MAKLAFLLRDARGLPQQGIWLPGLQGLCRELKQFATCGSFRLVEQSQPTIREIELEIGLVHCLDFVLLVYADHNQAQMGRIFPAEGTTTNALWNDLVTFFERFDDAPLVENRVTDVLATNFHGQLAGLMSGFAQDADTVDHPLATDLSKICRLTVADPESARALFRAVLRAFVETKVTALGDKARQTDRWAAIEKRMAARATRAEEQAQRSAELAGRATQDLRQAQDRSMELEEMLGTDREELAARIAELEVSLERERLSVGKLHAPDLGSVLEFLKSERDRVVRRLEELEDEMREERDTLQDDVRRAVVDGDHATFETSFAQFCAFTRLSGIRDKAVVSTLTGSNAADQVQEREELHRELRNLNEAIPILEELLPAEVTEELDDEDLEEEMGFEEEEARPAPETEPVGRSAGPSPDGQSPVGEPDKTTGLLPWQTTALEVLCRHKEQLQLRMVLLVGDRFRSNSEKRWIKHDRDVKFGHRNIFWWFDGLIRAGIATKEAAERFGLGFMEEVAVSNKGGRAEMVESWLRGLELRDLIVDGQFRWERLESFLTRFVARLGQYRYGLSSGWRRKEKQEDEPTADLSELRGRSNAEEWLVAQLRGENRRLPELLSQILGRGLWIWFPPDAQNSVRTSWRMTGAGDRMAKLGITARALPFVVAHPSVTDRVTATGAVRTLLSLVYNLEAPADKMAGRFVDRLIALRILDPKTGVLNLELLKVACNVLAAKQPLYTDEEREQLARIHAASHSLP